jgi:type VI secretion system protein ImpK
MQNPTATNSPLLLQFRHFHRELLQILAHLDGSGPVRLKAGDKREDGISSEEIAQRLVSLMQVQALSSGRDHSMAHSDLYREMQYVMAALADELILSSNWPGKSTWTLLESRLFQSHASGEVFFQRLDKILHQPVTAYSDLEHIYFYALALGFRGKYRGANDHGRLAQYRQKLYLRIYQRPEQDLIHADRPQLFSQPYRYTLEEYSARRLPGTRIWVLCLVSILGLWIAISDALWRKATAQVTAEIKRIHQDITELDHSTQSSQPSVTTAPSGGTSK